MKGIWVYRPPGRLSQVSTFIEGLEPRLRERVLLHLYVTPQDDPDYASAPFTVQEDCGLRTADFASLEGTEDDALAQEPQDLRFKSSEMRASRTAEPAALEPQILTPSKKEKRKIENSHIEVSLFPRPRVTD